MDNTKTPSRAKQGAINYGNNVNREKNTSSEEEENPPMNIIANTSASHSLMSSIGIGEYGMNTAKKGNKATFVITVKEHLF